MNEGRPMALLLKSGGIFLHIPKTGGSWVTKILKEQNLVKANFGHKHASFDRVVFRENFEKSHKLIPSLMGRWFTKYFARTQLHEDYMFCFVRHPLSWLESYWRYRVDHDWKHWGTVRSKVYWHPNAILNGLGDNDFSQFEEWDGRPGYVSEFYSEYTKAGINFIGRQENLTEDLITALNHLNENFDEDYIRSSSPFNVTKTPKTKATWDPEVRRAALITELPALIHYGYLNDAEKEDLDLTGIDYLTEAAEMASNPLPTRIKTAA